jgi:hypothetical protein
MLPPNVDGRVDDVVTATDAAVEAGPASGDRNTVDAFAHSARHRVDR